MVGRGALRLLVDGAGYPDIGSFLIFKFQGTVAIGAIRCGDIFVIQNSFLGNTD
jgi:hypothetical protein